jgi:hypothetical protein
VATFHDRTGRKGVTPDAARTIVRTSNSAIAAVALERGDADAMICGVEGRFTTHLRHIRQVIGLKEGCERAAALSLLITSKGRSSSPTPMSPPTPRVRTNSPTWSAPPPSTCAASVSSRRSRSFPIPISAATTTIRS